MKTDSYEDKLKGCSCKECVNCCSCSCGWFGSIEEVENASKLMKMSLPEFAREYLIQEYWVGKEAEDILVIAPRKNFEKMKKYSIKELKCNATFILPVLTIQELSKKTKTSRITAYSALKKEDTERNGKGFVKASWGHNLMSGVPCIFLDKNNLCKIHESKPQECRESFACKKEDDFKGRDKIAEYWKKKKNKSFILNLEKEVRKLEEKK
jgi:Fe-S-cluster containining protein